MRASTLHSEALHVVTIFSITSRREGLLLICGNLVHLQQAITELRWAVQERTARTEVINIMSSNTKTLPLYVWLVALPQLISRICHPHLDTQKMIQHLLTRVTGAYPQQVCLIHYVSGPAHCPINGI